MDWNFNTLIELTLIGLAIWRFASLVAREHGPRDVLDRFRYWAGVRYDADSELYGTSIFSKGIICMWCNTVWFGALGAVGYALFRSAVVWIALPFALSALALLVESLVKRDE